MWMNYIRWWNKNKNDEKERENGERGKENRDWLIN